MDDTSLHEIVKNEQQPLESVLNNNGEQKHSGEDSELDEVTREEAAEKARREREARAQALTLEIVGDLPYAEVKPPENVLFVCKLNPVTEDEDLELIFSRFGKILSCEVIRDKRTGDSLQYAFIEFENQKDCEQAYFKMQGVLIDDHRIHVDFSQSVSRLSDTWRNATNAKRAQQRGGFGGVSSLEKKRQYRAAEANEDVRGQRSQKYDMVFGKSEIRQRREGQHYYSNHRYSRSRSRSPPPRDRYRNNSSIHREGRSSRRDGDFRRNDYEDRNRRR